MESAGDGVAAAAELAAGMEDRHDDLDGGPVLSGVIVDGDAATIVDDLNPAVGLNGDFDVVAVTGEGLIHGIVDDLVHQVMQPALTSGADVHAGPFAHRLESLENSDVGGAVVGRPLADRRHGRHRRRRGRRGRRGLCGGHRLVLVRHVSAAPLSVRRAGPDPSERLLAGSVPRRVGGYLRTAQGAPWAFQRRFYRGST